MVRLLASASVLLFVMSIYFLYRTLEPVHEADVILSKTPYTASTTKLLTLSTEDEHGNKVNDDRNNSNNEDDNINNSMKRIGEDTSTSCTKDNILVFQGPSSPLPDGIPTYTVEIQNVCLSDSCSISDIHLSCGWFSSARLINPRVFRRIGYDDCLVNDGQPLNPGEALSFQYANTFKYPLSVSSVDC